MALTKEQIDFIKNDYAKSSGIIAAEGPSPEKMVELFSLEKLQQNVKRPTSFFERAKERFQRAGQRTTENIVDIAEGQRAGEQSKLRSGFQAAGALLSGGAEFVYGTLIDAAVPQFIAEGAKEKAKELMETPNGRRAAEAITEFAQGATEKWETLEREHPVLARDIKAFAGFLELYPGAKITGDILSGATKIGTDVATMVKTSTRRAFDATKPVAERISSVREAIGRPKMAGGAVLDVADEAAKPSLIQKFTENPSVTGALDDIKIMVGLPESTPSVDMTFRAVKPRLTKGIDLRRAKAQMQLANQTIAEQGLKPTGLKEYADAVYETKKNVWDQIDNSLKAGAAAGKEVDLIPIASKILDRADDPALLRTNPQAAKELTKIAEDMVRLGDNVSVLEAERMKQLINAELDGAFGVLDQSKHAKEAKKLITSEIGNQLDEILSELPDEFRDLKIKYGALSSIEEDILKRAIVFERQNPEGLADMLTKTEAAAELVFGDTKGRMRAVARLTMGKRLKKANDANDLVKRAFEKLSKDLGFNKAAMPEMAGVKKTSILGTPRKTDTKLPANLKEIENRAFERIDREKDAIIEAYRRQYGNVLNTDNFRDFFKEDGYTGFNAQAVHEPASELNNYMFKEIMENAQPGDTGVWLAGGPGSGKTSAVASQINHSDFVFDSVFGNFEKGVQRIEEAISKGVDPEIYYVLRDIDEAWFNGVVSRAMKKQRTVPLKVFLQSTEDAYNTALQLGKSKYKDIVAYIDNTRGAGNSSQVSIDKIKEVGYSNLVSRHYERLKQQTNQLYESGKISKEVRDGLIEV